MYLRRLAYHIRKLDWFVIAIELLVVIIGLMMAFQLDRWWEERGERKLEVVYIQRLIVDIESDIPEIEMVIQLAAMRQDYVDLLMAVSEDINVASKQPMSFLVAIDQAAFTASPILTDNTFEELRTTGNMRLIRNQGLKNSLHDYYRFDQSQWQYRPLQFSVEFHHFKLASGVRSNKQVRFLQDKWLLVSPDEQEEVRNTIPDDPGEILAAAKRLQDNPELVSWLTQLREMQMEQILISNTRLQKSIAILDELNQYISAR